MNIMQSFLTGKVSWRLRNNINLHRKKSMQLPHVIIAFLIISFTSSIALAEYRSFDGTGNNLKHPEWGSTGIQLRRLVKSDYSDGVFRLAGDQRLEARELSNILSAQNDSLLNSLGVSDMFWQWGQFLDHDIDLTETTNESYPIPVPSGDPHFDPDNTGSQSISFHRSVYDTSTGKNRGNPRQQVNGITAWIDASNVYGSDNDRAEALRTNDGTGKLKTSGGGKYLPYNTEGYPNAGGTDANLFLAGDVRANEQVALTAMHSLFVREHNRLCEHIAAQNPGLPGDDIYQEARRYVGALMQVITYKEFLPLLLGDDKLTANVVYNPSVDPGIANVFATAAYRFGHSMISNILLRYNYGGNETQSISLEDAFFEPVSLIINGGIGSILRGLVSQPAQKIDIYIVDGIRNFLFGLPGSGGFDLAALNIQRGRDHGLPDYNKVRKAFGLKQVKSFADITSDGDTQAALATAYAGSVNDIDLVSGGLAEDPRPGALLGETYYRIIRDQFTRLRDGDRFWYQNGQFTNEEVEMMEKTTLKDIIIRNTNLDATEIQDNVFIVNN